MTIIDQATCIHIEDVDMRLKKMTKWKASNVTLITNELSNFDNDNIGQAIKHQMIASLIGLSPYLKQVSNYHTIMVSSTIAKVYRTYHGAKNKCMG